MTEASLSAQRLAVATMRAHAPLTALVPAANILDRNERPEVFPCILVGEAQVIGSDIDCRDLSEVYLDLHLWTTENGLTACKQIAGEVRRAMRNVSAVQEGFACDFHFEDARFLRDPDGEHSHAVVSFMMLSEDCT